ncbi:hypothetical protein [Variovorax terrae]|uniref:Uncharacterized protein n=1 Tax=Variovorax terrae TaxID=2923278 RepID=A0A9X1VWF8_9BURK|nr:hypothetical protein [Variovorax terrae]MCJ0763334.1 hypothetical protein [Variovorax terrae]
MRKLIAVLLLSATLPLVFAAEPVRDWTWSESTCSATGNWLTYKGTASVVFTGSSLVAELHEKEMGMGLRHRIDGKVSRGKVKAVLSTMNTDSGDVLMTGKYSRKALKEFAETPVFEYIALTEGCSFIGLTRTTGVAK